MSTINPVTIAIVDDHSLFREGVASILNNEVEINVIIKVENGKELIKKLQKKRPQVVLMDVRMAIMDGIATTEYLREHYPEIKILGISMLNEKLFIIEMIKAGGHGYLNKNTSFQELKKAIISVLENGYYFNNNVTETMLKSLFNKQKAQININRPKLSVREMQILNLICKQMNTAKIADKLILSPRTVENYRQTLMDKTGVENVAGLVMYAIVNDLIKMDIDLIH